MSLLRTIVHHFVTPSGNPRPTAHEGFVPPDEEPDRACAEPAPRTPSGIAVLCGPGDALSLGAALGLALADRNRSPVVAVCVWTGGPHGPSGSPHGPAVPAARRLAASLARRGHDVRCAGRLAVVHLPAASEDAALQARRASGAAGAAPTALAVGGPRSAAFDDLLREQDLVVVAAPSGTEQALTRLALEGLATRGVRACACDLISSQLARAVAVAGLALLPAARRALADPLDALA
jgi:hypothetical protein